jgi:lysophospholipid acyltransferase
VRLPTNRPNLAHIFSLTVSTFFLWPFLDLGKSYLELIVSSAITYAIVAGLKGKNMPWIAFL